MRDSMHCMGTVTTHMYTYVYHCYILILFVFVMLSDKHELDSASLAAIESGRHPAGGDPASLAASLPANLGGDPASLAAAAAS